MRAAVLERIREPLRIKQVEDPRPGEDDVLIQVEACGVCHSDLHLARGDWPQLARIIKQPLILGHEVVGRVVARGASVRNLDEGERVGVPWIHWTCGTCELCLEGRENLCLNQMITGASVDGGYAGFMKARASHAARIPETLTSVEAAPLLCAGVTVYRAIRNAGIGKGHRTAVFGIGGLGHMAVQIAKIFGAEVIAVDVADEKLQLAKSLGADRILNASRQDIRKEIRALGLAHYAVVTSSSKEAYQAGFSSLRRAGTLVLVGVPAEDLHLTPIVMVGGEFVVRASAVGTRSDLADVLDLAASGRIRCQAQTRELDEINDVFAAMDRGAVQGRIVLNMRA